MVVSGRSAFGIAVGRSGTSFRRAVAAGTRPSQPFSLTPANPETCRPFIRLQLAAGTTDIGTLRSGGSLEALSCKPPFSLRRAERLGDGEFGELRPHFGAG